MPKQNRYTLDRYTCEQQLDAKGLAETDEHVHLQPSPARKTCAVAFAMLRKQSLLRHWHG
jgi:hypothetical protein